MVQTIPDAQYSGMPIGAFNFHVAIEVEKLAGAKGPQICQGAFSEVSGLEASMEAKVIKAGGHNYGAFQRAGAVTFTTVVLKRGMSPTRDLWLWWSAFADIGAPPAKRKPLRRDVFITQLDSERKPAIVWKLENAMPVKFKIGDMSAKSGEVAIEELHIVHEGLRFEPPEARS
jgi:phage tail-like protein